MAFETQITCLLRIVIVTNNSCTDRLVVHFPDELDYGDFDYVVLVAACSYVGALGILCQMLFEITVDLFVL